MNAQQAQRQIDLLKRQNLALRCWIEKHVTENHADSIWQPQWFEMRDSAIGTLERVDAMKANGDLSDCRHEWYKAVGKLSKGTTLRLPSR